MARIFKTTNGILVSLQKIYILFHIKKIKYILIKKIKGVGWPDHPNWGWSHPMALGGCPATPKG
jgi:hypothetical protein